MNHFRLLALTFILIGCRTGDPGAGGKGESVPPPTRVFDIEYRAWVKEVPAGSSLRLWIPVPRDDSFQRISRLTVEAPVPYRFTREEVHGNRMLYLEAGAAGEDLEVTLSYRVERREDRTGTEQPGREVAAGSMERYGHYLAPSRLVVVDRESRQLAARLGAGRGDDRERARAFADHVMARMRYAKPAGVPWGRGDTRFARTACLGNCTDYHSWFISLCRAAGIPARFQIGLFGPYRREPGRTHRLGGYHCWAQFIGPDGRWIPVDLSEADKLGDTDPERAAWLFGNHTDNRVTLSTGRDLRLAPGQQGPLLNYFLAPYAEVEGRPHPVTGKEATWKDIR